MIEQIHQRDIQPILTFKLNRIFGWLNKSTRVTNEQGDKWVNQRQSALAWWTKAWSKKRAFVHGFVQVLDNVDKRWTKIECSKTPCFIGRNWCMIFGLSTLSTGCPRICTWWTAWTHTFRCVHLSKPDFGQIVWRGKNELYVSHQNDYRRLVPLPVERMGFRIFGWLNKSTRETFSLY